MRHVPLSSMALIAARPMGYGLPNVPFFVLYGAMPESSRHTVAQFGIAALYDVAGWAGKQPLSPSTEPRAALTLLRML
jgi:hypothetical protein